MRATTRILLVTITVLAGASPAAAQSITGCDAVLPGTAWEEERRTGPVRIRTVGLAPELVDRIARDLAQGITLIESDMGGLSDVEVCVFPAELPLDTEALGWPEGHILRAASFGPERALVISARDVAQVRPLGIFALAHQAQWAVGGADYPQPWGESVGQWYISRASGGLSGDHTLMRFANLVSPLPDNIPWAAEPTEPLVMWNPQFRRSSIGDFVQFAVSNAGPRVLLEPDGATLSALQAQWQESLLNEARGSDEPTSGWVWGLLAGAVAVGGALALGLARALSGRRKKLPRQKPIPVVDSKVSASDQER